MTDKENVKIISAHDKVYKIIYVLSLLGNHFQDITFQGNQL